jgi:hypothetical protein
LSSRKPSDISKQHDDPIFFLDRSFGKRKLADALRAADFKIEIHDEHFPQNATDPVWLKACGERGWIVITADKRMEHQWAHVISSAAVAVFILSSNNTPAEEWAEPIKKHRAKILRLIKKTRPPFTVHITPDGIGTPRNLRLSRKKPSRENGGAKQDRNRRKDQPGNGQ